MSRVSPLMEENNQFNNMALILDQVDSVDAYFDYLPCGYRFSPTDAELVSCYLKPKVLNQELPLNRFRTVDIYQHHPEELTRSIKLIRDREWYFFSPTHRKYPNGHRPNRKAVSGFWKATGKVVTIKDVKGEVALGSKRSLDFYVGTPGPGNGRRTDWKMHEYKLNEEIAPPNKIGDDTGGTKLDNCILCKIYKKADSEKDENVNNAEGTKESDQEAVADTSIVTSQAFPDQSIQLPQHQHQSLPVGESSGTSSPANKRHCGMSNSTILNNNVGYPTYYDHPYSFPNQTFGYQYHPESINNFNIIQNCTPYNMHSGNFVSHVVPRDSCYSQFPADSMQTGTGMESVNQLPLVDPSSIRLPAHVLEYELKATTAREEGGHP